jgi:hypothetical protein
LEISYPIIFFNEARITTIPTRIMSALVGILVDNLAAIGAATIPPKIKPRITCHCENPMTKIKVNEDEREIKNSAKLTEPIV